MSSQEECNSKNNKPIKNERREEIQVNSGKSVSYTHLDVYKRQELRCI